MLYYGSRGSDSLSSVRFSCDCCVGKNTASVPGQFHDSQPFRADRQRDRRTLHLQRSAVVPVGRAVCPPLLSIRRATHSNCRFARISALTQTQLSSLSSAQPLHCRKLFSASSLFYSNSLPLLRPICIPLSLRNLVKNDVFFGCPCGVAFGKCNISTFLGCILRRAAVCAFVFSSAFLSAYAEICMPTLSASFTSIRSPVRPPSHSEPQLCSEGFSLYPSNFGLSVPSSIALSFLLPSLPPSLPPPPTATEAVVASFDPGAYSLCARTTDLSTCSKSSSAASPPRLLSSPLRLSRPSRDSLGRTNYAD